MHKSLWMTPAMASGVTERRWSMEDPAVMIDGAGAKPGKRGAYKKRWPRL